jgi:hypothetical protein
MCHEWLWRRFYEEREPGRELWDEFERTRPLNDPEPADEEVAITLAAPEAEPAAAER